MLIKITPEMFRNNNFVNKDSQKISFGRIHQMYNFLHNLICPFLIWNYMWSFVIFNYFVEREKTHTKLTRILFPQNISIVILYFNKKYQIKTYIVSVAVEFGSNLTTWIDFLNRANSILYIIITHIWNLEYVIYIVVTSS